MNRDCQRCPGGDEAPAVWTVKVSNGPTVPMCGRCYDQAAHTLRLLGVEFGSVME